MEKQENEEKKDTKAFFKNKGVYVTLILGALIIMVALGINKSLSNSKNEQNGLIDLNESPNIVSTDDTDKGISIVDHSDDMLNQNHNDNLLEFDIYNGSAGNQSINSNILDKTVDSKDAGNELDAVDQVTDDETQKVDTSSVVEAPKNTEQDETPNDEENADTVTEDDTLPEETNDDLTDVIGATAIDDLKFSVSDGLLWPVRGDVILGYSDNHAIYHATLQQFKTNPAILISCEAGTQVLATVPGVVTDITNTPQTGLTLTLAIGDDYSLVYGQLQDVQHVIGDTIEAGELFATIAPVSKYYSVEGEHLYFQVFEGEKTMNPMLVLKDE